MSEVFGAEPPPAGSGRGRSRAPLAERLRREPGTWAYFTLATPASARTTAYQIRQGQGPWAPAGAFEAMAREVDVRRGGSRVRQHRVYVRALPEKGEGDE